MKKPIQLLLGTNNDVFVGKAVFQREWEGSRKFQPEAEIFGIFSIEVAPYLIVINQ